MTASCRPGGNPKGVSARAASVAVTRGPQATGGGVLVFVHIPKAAGSTLTDILVRQYARDAVYRCGRQRPGEVLPAADAAVEVNALPAFQSGSIRCVVGHVRFGVHCHLQRPVTYITMVREPVQRIVSLYHYIRRTPQHPRHRELVDKNLTLEQYVDDPASAHTVDNVQVRQLYGGDPTDGPASLALEIVKKRLRDDFAAVGVAERFDASLLLYRRLLGWGTVYYRRQNVAPVRSPRVDGSREVIRQIERRNGLDLELYEYAVRLLEDRLGEHGVTAGHVSRFTTVNRSYGAYDAARTRGERLVRRLRKRVAGMRRRPRS